ncbi:hypothetical protein DC522_32910 [Microvirga sp. KLBC 81]|uniref:hypothetical protein n=1 Tax=Microvirga sp. KLBC 81 TaxID=1862707 RepID=UPI000D52205D|nr:hypothetical protein [Microvirga sp. KLBC 81]PVE20341.1 hypothetical protein DC522_32910 [Microvirga sp. KLBC 81]
MIAADHEGLPTTWPAATVIAANRKQMIHEIILDQKRSQGQVWLRIVWQTEATSEHRLQQRVYSYCDQINLDRRRITDLNAVGKIDKEIASELNRRLRRLPRLFVQG